MYDADTEFDLLQRAASAVGLYAQRHKNYDPCRGKPGGEYYLMIKRDRMNYKQSHDSLIKYSTLDECYAFINEWRDWKKENSV